MQQGLHAAAFALCLRRDSGALIGAATAAEHDLIAVHHQYHAQQRWWRHMANTACSKDLKRETSLQGWGSSLECATCVTPEHSLNL